MDLTVSTPETASTRKAWFSAPRLNFSLSRVAEDRGQAEAEERHRAAGRPATISVSSRAVDEQHRQKDDGEEQVERQGQCRGGQELADGLQLAHPRHGVADPPRLEIGHRQGEQVAEEPRAQLDIDAVGGVGEEIGAQAAEDDLENREQAEPERQHLQGRQAAMDQHLVDDDLEEQRRQQRRRAAGRTRRPAPRRAAARYFLTAPTNQPMPNCRAGSPRPRGGSTGSAARSSARRNRRGSAAPGRRDARILHQHLVFGDPAEHQPAAVLQPGQGRQRRLLQPLEAGAMGARLDREMPRRPQQIGLVERRLAAVVERSGPGRPAAPASARRKRAPASPLSLAALSVAGMLGARVSGSGCWQR